MIKVKTTGFRELGLALKELDAKVQRNVLRAASNAGAQVVKKAIARKAPLADEPYTVSDSAGNQVLVPPGNLKKQMIVKRLKPSETPLSVEHLVTMRSKREHGYARRIGTLQEFGTVKQAPQPFFRPGAEEAMQPAIDAIKSRFKQRIDKAIRELSK
jgi:HK97 gp10 family phage protein